ncbi:MAG: SDR family NAD(P)-dependent oxidoreductase [Rhodobacter sp.]|nr:SDR family NAD(P)-dependent oxidoreductase [Rhodobacter sp.]
MRRALVTGGNRGIGYAVAAGLRAAGLEVVIGARDGTSGAEAAGGLGVGAAVLDVTDAAVCREVVEVHGPFDVLVNNAGILSNAPLFGQPDDFARHLAVMVQGPHDLIGAVLPGMRARGYGRIVNVSSGWGSFAEGLGGPGAYGVAKAALNALTVAAARQAGPGIKVNAMCPGWVRTRMGGSGANLSPEEGADTAIWLAILPEDGPTGGFFRRRRPIAW